MRSAEIFIRAFKDTIKFFGINRKTAFLTLCFIAGSGVHLWRFGWSEALTEFDVWLSYVVAPTIGFGLVLFLWNMFLTPSRILFDEIKALGSYNSSDKFDEDPISKPNYAVWRALESATIFEIARVCADEEPRASRVTGKQVPFENAIKQGVRKGKIKRADAQRRQVTTIIDYGDSGEYEEYYPSLSSGSEVYIADVKSYFEKCRLITTFFNGDT